MRLISNEELVFISGGGDEDSTSSSEIQVVEVRAEKMGWFEKLWYDITTPRPSATEIAKDLAYTSAYTDPLCQTTIAATEHGLTTTFTGTVAVSPSVSDSTSKQGVSVTTSVICKLP